MRALAFVLLAAILAPVAMAQTHAVPIRGGYDQVYVLSGRALDVDGDPVAGGKLVIELEQDGVSAEPLRATANCKGDFITAFNGLVYVDPKGKARITLEGPDGKDATTTVPLNAFWRRSDTVVKLDTQWAGTCRNEQDVWAVSASVAARILNRTEPYVGPDGEHQFHARPYQGIIRLRYELPSGGTICPPHPQSEDPRECETFIVDERGDMRYTFTLDRPFQAGGRVSIILQDNSEHPVTIDPASRIGFAYIEATGQGPLEVKETPGASAGLVAFGLLVALVLARRR